MSGVEGLAQLGQRHPHCRLHDLGITELQVLVKEVQSAAADVRQLLLRRLHLTRMVVWWYSGMVSRGQ